MQRTNDRRWHITCGYGVSGLFCALLPVFDHLGLIPGFVCLTIVIVFCLSPNGCLLALASSSGQGPAMPFNLAVFNSIGNVAGFFGSLLLGVVVSRTCSYNAAYVIMGVVLMLGGLLALLVQDKGDKRRGAPGADLHGDAMAMELVQRGSPSRPPIPKAPWMEENVGLDIPDEL